ncbi:MAG: YicC family protein [Proteobacteria bacterium]|nr:YicC family protein [Pseudomonadota bacterium]
MTMSMTGYGRANFELNNETFFVDIRTLNHRYLDIKLRVTDRLSGLEQKVKEAVKARLERGAVTLSIFAEESGDGTKKLSLNVAAAREFLAVAEVLKNETNVTGEVTLETLLKQRDIFTVEKNEIEEEAAWKALSGALDAAFTQLEEWRSKEGASLELDLRSRIATISEHLDRVELRAPEIKAGYRKRLEESIARLLDKNAEETRIIQEAAFFAERCDISEEITRAKSHFNLFYDYLKSKEPVGKRLDFLCQEIFREVNTVASKANDAHMKQTVVEMKGELEKMREQVQNIE